MTLHMENVWNLFRNLEIEQGKNPLKTQLNLNFKKNTRELIYHFCMVWYAFFVPCLFQMSISSKTLPSQYTMTIFGFNIIFLRFWSIDNFSMYIFFFLEMFAIEWHWKKNTEFKVSKFFLWKSFGLFFETSSLLIH